MTDYNGDHLSVPIASKWLESAIDGGVGDIAYAVKCCQLFPYFMFPDLQ